ncbi:MAG: cupin domain-containing protein [Phycisphaeraceae bacterium]|nr:cupin domain-containing protein [Phycisphaeraceae bacterium]
MNATLKPVFLGPEEGPTQYAPGGDRIITKLISTQTGGFEWIETDVNPGGGPPLHVHDREDEVFYVLEGEISFWICEQGDRTGKTGKRFVARKGAIVFGSRGTAHAFKNCSQVPARMLVMANPGANFEAFFAKIGAPDAGGNPPSQQVLIERTMKHASEFGITVLGPNPL